MSIAKAKRPQKRQKGQFLTPRPLARKIVDSISFRRTDVVLEPSMGDGSFILPLIEKFMKLYRGDTKTRLAKVLQNNVYGVELDSTLYARCLDNIKDKWGCLPPAHNFICGDFLSTKYNGAVFFDYVIGNPPFGGTINPLHQDILDREFGFRGGVKIKKETYSFFIVKSVELLKRDGQLIFICSDTFLTINTMKGLRDFLLANGEINVERIPYFSDEISQPTTRLTFVRGAPANGVTVDGKQISLPNILVTPNHSWQIGDDWVKYFNGPKIGDFMTASSGMTVGKNEYFVRDIIDGAVKEPYSFSFYQKPITLAGAMARARLGRLSEQRRMIIMRQEAAGETTRDVNIQSRKTLQRVVLPHPDYCYYNKARRGIVYAPPAHAIFWRDNGEAAYAYKQNGNWYLNGVGGKKYFFREGITWNLIASRLCLRYLPSGYVLDSGAPCAFLNAGIMEDEMFFILAWGLTDLCRDILKNVINHTKNIQGKDFERLPYPFWVDHEQKLAAIDHIREMIDSAQKGRTFGFGDVEVSRLNTFFVDGDFQCGDWMGTKRRQQIPLAEVVGGDR